MRKIAIFVEGQTEQFFIRKLLEEIAEKSRIAIELRKSYGGGNVSRKYEIVRARATTKDQVYYALIVDCGADSRVISDIRDNYHGLIQEGYRSIIAIRDVFPTASHSEIPQLRASLSSSVPNAPIQVTIALGVMETETWFISEHTHFPKLDISLTCQLIKNSLGFDPSIDDIQLRPHPADDLDQIYRLVGRRYAKTKAQVSQTTHLIDYAVVYLQLGARIPDLQTLINEIDSFMS